MTIQNGDRAITHQPRLPEALSLPVEVLLRHRARGLDPSTAITVAGQRRPETTAYRSDTLLMPLRDARSPETISRYNKELARLDAELRPVFPSTPAWLDALDTLHQDTPVPVLLIATADSVAAENPDPWVALVVLRRALAEEAQAIGLEHLVVAASTDVQGTPDQPRRPGQPRRARQPRR